MKIFYHKSSKSSISNFSIASWKPSPTISLSPSFISQDICHSCFRPDSSQANPLLGEKLVFFLSAKCFAIMTLQKHSSWYTYFNPVESVLSGVLRPTNRCKFRHPENSFSTSGPKISLQRLMQGNLHKVHSLKLSYFQNIDQLVLVINSLVTNTSERFNLRNISEQINESQAK